VAFPQVAEVIATDEEGSPPAADIDIDLGSSIASGDLLLVGVCGGGTSSITYDAITGWTKIVDGSVFAAQRWAWFKRKADGTEGGSVNVSHNGSDAHLTGLFVRIAAASWYGDLSTGVQVGGTASSFNSSPNPGTTTPAWGSADTLWIAAMAADDDDGGLNSYPTSYDDNQTLAMNTLGGGSTQCRLAIATRELAIDSENPGAFGLPATEQWAAGVIAVRPAAAAASVAPQAHHYAMRRSA